jgi:hypothetical protein
MPRHYEGGQIPASFSFFEKLFEKKLFNISRPSYAHKNVSKRVVIKTDYF